MSFVGIFPLDLTTDSSGLTVFVKNESRRVRIILANLGPTITFIICHVYVYGFTTTDVDELAREWWLHYRLKVQDVVSIYSIMVMVIIALFPQCYLMAKAAPGFNR